MATLDLHASMGLPIGLLGVLAIAVAAGPARATGTIETLQLPGATSTRATTLSADGAKAAGIGVGIPGLDNQAFLFDGGSIQALPHVITTPPTGYAWSYHRAKSAWLSDDGDTLVVEQDSVIDAGFGLSYVVGVAWRQGVPTVFSRIVREFAGSTTFEADLTGVSPDGSVAFGSTGTDFHGIQFDHVVYRWDTSLDEAQQPPGAADTVCAGADADSAETFAASEDGSVVVGYLWCYYELNPLPTVGFRWNAGGAFDYGVLTENPSSMQVSRDASMVTGTIGSGTTRQSFVWPQGALNADLATTLPGMTGAYPQISHLSADGAVLIGTADDGSGRVAFRWENGQLTWLGDLPGGAYASHVTAATPDGSVIVGVGETASGPAPFYWTAAGGLRPLTDVLSIDYGIALGGWTLDEVVDLSDDGLVLLGNGMLGGVEVGFRASPTAVSVVPGPAASVVGLAALTSALGCVGRRALRPRR